MPNGMQQPKEFLKQQASVPESIEAQLPQGAPKISDTLRTIAESMPEAPAAPAGFPQAPTSGQAPRVAEFVKSVEASLPEQAPKIGEAFSAAEESVAGAAEQATEQIKQAAQTPPASSSEGSTTETTGAATQTTQTKTAGATGSPKTAEKGFGKVF